MCFHKSVSLIHGPGQIHMSKLAKGPMAQRFAGGQLSIQSKINHGIFSFSELRRRPPGLNFESPSLNFLYYLLVSFYCDWKSTILEASPVVKGKARCRATEIRCIQLKSLILRTRLDFSRLRLRSLSPSVANGTRKTANMAAFVWLRIRSL
jgi:hypothetical protein